MSNRFCIFPRCEIVQLLWTPYASDQSPSPYFLTLKKEFPVFQSVSSASSPISRYYCKEPGSIFAHYLRVFVWIQSFLNLLFSRLNSIISLPIYVSCSKPLTILVALWTESNMSVSLLYLGTQDRTQQDKTQVWCPFSLHSITKYMFVGISCWIPLISYDESQSQNVISSLKGLSSIKTGYPGQW